MGYMRHHAILVSSWHQESLDKARQQALKTFDPCQVSNIVTSVVNTENTFLIGPDGSKEGWDTSDNGDTQRENYLTWLRAWSMYCKWVEVMYADDDGDAAVINHSESPEENHV